MGKGQNRVVKIFIFLAIFWKTFSFSQQEPQEKVPSLEEEIINKSLENLKKQSSLRFSILLESRLAGQAIMSGKLEGEGIPPDKSRVKGDVNLGKLQMYVDCIIIGDIQYERDRITGDWYKKKRIIPEDLFLKRDPFEIIQNVRKNGKFKYAGEKKWKNLDVYVYNFISEVKEAPKETEGIILIEKKENIFCKLYLKQTALRRDGLTASSLIEIEFYDFGKEIKIEPPEVYIE